MGTGQWSIVLSVAVEVQTTWSVAVKCFTVRHYQYNISDTVLNGHDSH